MIRTATVRLALRATAVMNLVAGTASVADPGLHARLLLAPGTVLEGATLRYHVMLWLFVAAMGVGYAVASIDPERQTALIWSGALGKLAAAGVWLEMFVHGLGAPLMIAGIVFDGALGSLLLAYVVGAPRRDATVTPRSD